MERRGNLSGLFVVFEGYDHSGKGTQQHLLTKHIQDRNKYDVVVQTHEPYKSKEIKTKLESEDSPYTNGLLMADLFIEYRGKHTREIVRPILGAGQIVNCDRYKMSTCAYQWAQGVPLEELINMHKDRGILVPDLTILLDLSAETAFQRMQKKQSESNVVSSAAKSEKFEKDLEFGKKVVEAYRCLAHYSKVDESFFGKVVTINAEQSIDEIAKEVAREFDIVYDEWSKNRNF